jgi:hypothetical protein
MVIIGYRIEGVGGQVHDYGSKVWILKFESQSSGFSVRLEKAGF